MIDQELNLHVNILNSKPAKSSNFFSRVKNVPHSTVVTLQFVLQASAADEFTIDRLDKLS